MASSAEYEHITHLKATMAQVRMLQADMLDQVAELERLQIAQHLGYTTTRLLLIDALRVDPRVATRMVAQAELVAETLTPTGHTTPAALHEGVLDTEHIAAVAKAVQQIPEWVSLDNRILVESTLAETARHHQPRVVRDQAEQLLARLDQDGDRPDEDLRQAKPGNWFRSQRDRAGRMRFRGELEPESAEVFQGLLNHLAKPQPPAKGHSGSSLCRGAGMAMRWPRSCIGRPIRKAVSSRRCQCTWT